MTPPTVTARVLLAEDNSDHAFFTTRAFQEAHGGDLHMHTVTDGEQLLDYLRQQGDYADAPRPHLVVLDLKMPKKNGLEVLAEMREDEQLSRIPVVVLSSSDRVEDISESYARGANSYVTKAASLTGLREGVGELARYWMDIASLPEPA
ncbi:MAG: two-component response regulator [Frankiales bacterium]|jgi:chemotaxis family two-component system response regulator Rcp1|nr:two-component response regulator [Frankiales bacterium]